MQPTRSEEVELKLQLPPEDLPRLRRHPRIRALTRGRSAPRLLESTYFDTADFALARLGLVLRLRRVGRTTVQGVKTRGAGQAGLFRRGEWEVPIVGDQPQLERVPDAALRARIEGALHGQALAPVFQTLVRRASRRIGEHDWEAQLDLDIGEAKTPKGSLPICELELELLRGDPGALYDLALTLHETISVRPAVVGKAERGLAVVIGEHPAPRRARRPTLAHDATLDFAMGQTFASCLDQITANEMPALEAIDPEGVHQMRVGIRRLRSALALFRGVIPQDRRDALRRELRWLGGELGDARDLDVLLSETLEPMLEHAPQLRAELEGFREAARSLREEGYARVRAALASRRYTGLLLALGAWTAGHRWRHQPLSPDSARLFAPAREVGHELLERRYAKVRRRGKRVPHLSVAQAHQLRIQAKKLRYASGFLGDLYPARRTDRFIRRLGRLQETLGHLNDQSAAETMLARILARLGADVAAEHHRAAGFVTGWTSHVALEGLRPIEKHWRRFAKLEPFWKA